MFDNIIYDSEFIILFSKGLITIDILLVALEAFIPIMVVYVLIRNFSKDIKSLASTMGQMGNSDFV